MTLLAPAALVGLLLLALPVIVHLLKPRKMRQTPFSTLRWLKQTRQRLSRRVQWHQWLLFAMRAGVIALLVIALARPVVGGRASRGPADRFVVVDSGRAMAYAGADGETAFDRARSLAAGLAGLACPGDRTAILLGGGPTKVLAPLSADVAPHLAKLHGAAVQSSDVAVSHALALVPMLLGHGSERDVEVIVLTSNQRHAWRQSDVQALAETYGERLRVQVIDVSPAAPHNAWVAGARLVQRGEERLLRVELGCVGGERAERSVRLTGVEGLGDEVRPAVLQPGQTTRVDFALPAAVSPNGQVAELRLEPGDALASDDRYYVNLDAPWALRVLLVDTGGEGPGLYLRAALDALAASGNDAFRVTPRGADGVTAADVQDSDLILLADVPKLSGDVTAALERRVRAGAGLIAFVGPHADAAFYREQLHRPLQPGEGLLPTAPDATKQPGPVSLRQVRWSHPLLTPLHDPLVNDVSLCRFTKYHALSPEPGKDDVVLARFDDGTPALVEHPLGAGRVLLWNTSADDAWTDLPRRRSFVPLVDRMVSYLTGGARRQFTAGEPITIPVAAGATKVIGPGGAEVPSRLQPSGAQWLLRLEASDPGVYRVEVDGAKPLRFAVNAGRGASPLAPTDARALEAWWAPASFELLGADAATGRLADEPAGWPLWPALLVLAGLLLAAEALYVARLCPRGNPAVATSAVPRRGILKPSGGSAG